MPHVSTVPAQGLHTPPNHEVANLPGLEGVEDVPGFEPDTQTRGATSRSSSGTRSSSGSHSHPMFCSSRTVAEQYQTRSKRRKKSRPKQENMEKKPPNASGPGSGEGRPPRPERASVKTTYPASSDKLQESSHRSARKRGQPRRQLKKNLKVASVWALNWSEKPKRTTRPSPSFASMRAAFLLRCSSPTSQPLCMILSSG